MIQVSGWSDDLIEIDGDWQDEIGCYGQTVNIEFDDGTEIEVKYDDNVDGAWKVKVLREGSADHRTEKLVDNDDYDYYSDLFTIETDGIVSVKIRPE